MAVVINYGAGQSSSGYSPNDYEEFGMIGKVAMQIIRGVEGKNPLSVFKKMPVDNGDTIEQAVVKLVDATAYDPTGAGALTRDDRVKMAVQYFKNWSRFTYKTTVDIAKVRKVLLADKGAGDIAERLVSELSQSRIHDEFQNVKGLLYWGTTYDSWAYVANTSLLVKKDDVDLVDGKTDYKGILKQMKDLVKGMQFVSTAYNRAGIKRSTKEEDIIIVMPYTLKNAIDVDELAGVFNLDKAELRNKIIETDDTEHKYVYVLDKNAVLDFTRLYEMADQKNADGLFWNYFLHVEDLYALSPLFDGCFFEYDTTPAQAGGEA